MDDWCILMSNPTFNYTKLCNNHNTITLGPYKTKNPIKAFYDVNNKSCIKKIYQAGKPWKNI